MGHGSEARVTIRIFRGDEPEIVEYVEQWRVLICAYLISKCDTIGSLNLPVGLSKIGAYVSRPIGTYMQRILFFIKSLSSHTVLSFFFELPDFRIVMPSTTYQRNHFVDDV